MIRPIRLIRLILLLCCCAGVVFAEPASPKKPTIKLSQEVRFKLHEEALKLMLDEDWSKGVKVYKEILRSDNKDQIALYNVACAHARLGNTEKALKFLERAMKSGFVDFGFIDADPDLETLRTLDAYKDLLSRKDAFAKKATKTAIARITQHLDDRKIDASAYETFVDKERNFVYLHTRSAEELQIVRDTLNAYAERQWKFLFKNKPGSPVYIVLLTREDSPKVLGRAKGGVFNPGANILYCGYAPGSALRHDSVVIHEFTHALHYADLAVRRQQHPPWLVEGLASLFESNTVENDRVVPRHSHRLQVVQDALRHDKARSWPVLMQLDSAGFLRHAHLNYAQACYILYYVHDQGLLKTFYDEYTHGNGFEADESARKTFESVFKKPLDEIEKDWKIWVLAQEVPPAAFLGIGMAPFTESVVVTGVFDGSGAEKAGVKTGDVLRRLNGMEIRTPSAVVEAILGREVGDDVSLELERDGETLVVSAKLGERPPEE